MKTPTLLGALTAAGISMLPAASAPEAVNSLGLSLLRNLETPGTNALISPYSIQQAMVMAFAGAAGDTRTQMARALDYAEMDAVAEFASLAGALGASESADSKTQLSMANRLFGQAGYPFHQAFLDTLRDRLGAPMEYADFAKSPLSATKRINGWVEEQTRKKIRNLIPPPAITEETRLVIVNAIYLKAPWLNAFDPKNTREAPFQTAAGASKTLPFLNKTDSFGYWEGDGFKAAALPYADRNFQFVVILPDGDPSEFLASVGADFFKQAARMPSRQVALSMPKFRLEPDLLELRPALEKLGMPSAFDIPRGSADFSGIAPRQPDDYLFIDAVFHKAFIEIDEAGTEAAAATAVVMMRATSAPMEPVRLTVDKPFLFAVQHRPTGACLFLGCVSEP